jgi:ribosomal protein L21
MEKNKPDTRRPNLNSFNPNERSSNLHPMFWSNSPRKQIISYRGHRSLKGGVEVNDIDELAYVIGKFEERYDNEHSKSLLSQIMRISASMDLYNNANKNNAGINLINKKAYNLTKPVAKLIENKPDKSVADLIEQEKPMADLVEQEKPMADLIEQEKPAADLIEDKIHSKNKKTIMYKKKKIKSKETGKGNRKTYGRYDSDAGSDSGSESE